MSVDCLHWSACGVRGGGCCSLLGKRPSVGVCGRCDQRRPRPADSTSRGPSFELPDDEAAVEAARRTVRAGGCCGQPRRA